MHGPNQIHFVQLKDDSWRYCRASLYANHTIKRDIVIVDGKEEKHPEGNYYVAHAEKWINVGADALEAQRKQSRLLHGNMVGVSEPDKLKLAAIQSTAPDGRKQIKDEVTAYLDAMVEAKRPEKSVRMNRNFLNAFADLIDKRFCDEYSREDVVKFRNKLLGNGYSRKYISTQMDFVLTFFRHHIGMPIQMKNGDHLEYATNPPEPYADQEIVAMERTAKGRFNLIVFIAPRAAACKKSPACMEKM